MNLRTKLILSALLVLMPVLILLTHDYRTAYETQKDQVFADQLRTAQIVSVVVDDAFDEALGIARSYAVDPVILSFDRGRIDSYLRRLSPLHPEYDSVAGVFDARGNLGGAAIDSAPINVADRPWFQDVMGTGKPVVAGVMISRATGRPIMTVAAPIVDQEGKRLGAVASAVSLDYFPKILETVERAPGQQIFMADPEGRLAFHTGKPELTWEERDASGYLPIRTALGGKLFAIEPVDSLLGDRRMVVATATPKYGWVVGVSVPTDVALASVRDGLRNTLVVFAGVIVFSIGLAMALAEFLLRPLRQLTGHADALSRGELQQRVKITTGDELEHLGHSFNAMTDALQEASRLREEFLTVAAHELRTPLTVIRGYSQWLLAKETDEDKQKRQRIIVRQTERIGELLDEMLMVSELRAGRVELNRQRMDLTALAKELTDEMQMITEKHQLLFRGYGPAIVNADYNRIEVVLTNLIDNAIRYSPKGGKVGITISREGAEAIVSVSDHGLGIPEAKKKHVFEPFFQMQPAIAGYGGMGLGLFISNELIAQHGGGMWFESKEDAGSTFYFSLPLATDY